MSKVATLGRRPKWHIIYYALASFDLLMISGSLYLNHRIMETYTDSVAVSRSWAEIQGRFIDLGRLASMVNAPGNDVFDSGDVAGELAERNLVLRTFDEAISRLRGEVLDGLPPGQAGPLLDGLGDIDAAMRTMVAEADLIFSHFRESRTVEAARRMATMDRKYARVTEAVAEASDFVRRLRAEHFDRQVAAATVLRRFEYLIAGLIALMVALATLYGHMIARKIRQTEQEKADVLDALKDNEEVLERRVDELCSANAKLEQQGRELTELASHLRQARDKAVAADKAKSRFLALMSHELRTPLNAIIGYSDLIKSDVLGRFGTDRYRDYAEDINEAGLHLLDLITDILDLAKIESGAIELREESIDVRRMVRSALALLRERAATEDIALEAEVPDGLPGLRADARSVKQVLVNLLSNAIKFTAAGGKVLLRVRPDPEAGYLFQVVDTGIGIAPQDMTRALTLFGQIDNPLNRRYEGTGLGLPLSKALIERQGGTLSLQSEVGVGTTVSVRFPAARMIAARPAA